MYFFRSSDATGIHAGISVYTKYANGNIREGLCKYLYGNYQYMYRELEYIWICPSIYIHIPTVCMRAQLGYACAHMHREIT